VWVDGSLQDHEWYSHVFKDIRKRFPLYKIAILYVFADEKDVIDRAENRAQVTGRVVPVHILKSAIRKTATSIERLAPLADFAARIENLPSHDADPTDPKVFCPIVDSYGQFIPFQRGEGRDDWTEVHKRFATVEVDKVKLDAMFDPILDGHDVVVFGKSYCTYSAKLLFALRGALIPFGVIEVDHRPDGLSVQVWLKSKSETQMSTMPQVFVKGQHIGGCDDTLAELESGRLKERLAMN